MKRVAVCIATYRRPQGLRELLRSLAANPSRNAVMHVIVIDNDEAGSAAGTIAEFAGRLPALTYEVEPRRGIPFARNRAVQLAVSAGADYVAFVDDDETVEPGWLDGLLQAVLQPGVGAATGPVLPQYPAGTPAWVAACRFFDRPVRTNGERLPVAATNNVLVSAAWLQKVPGPFDERLRYTGGSDTHLFRRLVALGMPIVWANDAAVSEVVPPSRANLRWILHRAYRLGNTLAVCDRMLGGSPVKLGVRVVKACGRIAQGVVMLPGALVGGRPLGVRALVNVARGAGMLAGLGGFRYEEYRRTTGT